MQLVKCPIKWKLKLGVSNPRGRNGHGGTLQGTINSTKKTCLSLPIGASQQVSHVVFDYKRQQMRVLRPDEHLSEVLDTVFDSMRAEHGIGLIVLFPNSWILFVRLEQLSRPSSQTTWLKVKPHC